MLGDEDLPTRAFERILHSAGNFVELGGGVVAAQAKVGQQDATVGFNEARFG
jgi:hypothetical protein